MGERQEKEEARGKSGGEKRKWKDRSGGKMIEARKE